MDIIKMQKMIEKVRDMRGGQLCYYGQDITVSESEKEGFYNVKMDLTIMDVNIVCKEILVRRVSRSETSIWSVL